MLVRSNAGHCFFIYRRVGFKCLSLLGFELYHLEQRGDIARAAMAR